MFPNLLRAIKPMASGVDIGPDVDPVDENLKKLKGLQNPLPKEPVKLPDTSGIAAVRPQISANFDPSKIIGSGQGVSLPEAAPVRAVRPVISPSSGSNPIDLGKPPQIDVIGKPDFVPALPGRGNEPVPYDPVTAARYDYAMKGAERDADGNLTGGGIKRSWKDVLKSAAIGFAQATARDPRNPLAAGLGGAATAGTLTAVNPALGREYQFESIYRPEIESRQQREQDRMKAVFDAEDRFSKRDADRLARAKTQAEVDKIRADIARREGDDEGLMSVNPEYDVLDKKTGKVIRSGVPKLQAQRPDLPFSSAGRVIYDRRTGQITGEVPESESALSAPGLMKVPDSARKLLGEIEAARAANDQTEFNKKVAQLGGQFGDIFETGSGEGGWSYFKPKELPKKSRTPRATKPAGTPAQGSAAPLKRTVGSVVELLRKNKLQQ